MIRKLLRLWNEMRSARQTLYDEGYNEARMALAAMEERCRAERSSPAHNISTFYIGNIARGNARVDMDGQFTANHVNDLPPRWRSPVFVRGYHACLQDEFQTKFVRVTLCEGSLPSGCIEISVEGRRNDKLVDNVVRMRPMGLRREV